MNNRAKSSSQKRNGLEPADYYTDLQTGFMVFTEAYHRKRGYCCKNSCRHCPYGFLKNDQH